MTLPEENSVLENTLDFDSQPISPHTRFGDWSENADGLPVLGRRALRAPEVFTPNGLLLFFTTFHDGAQRGCSGRVAGKIACCADHDRS